ncbi:MAG: CoF synthetase, partial [Desulfobacterales bacterium]|nr:CoF synthetase [Desulfobacterales bacterium]
REDLEKVRDYRDAIRRGPKHWAAGEKPGWLEAYLARCSETVPAYRNCSPVLEENPSIGRGDLREAPWRFVSDDRDPDDLLVYSTSGTTGPAMDVLFDAVTQASWIPQLQEALRGLDLTLEGGADRVSIALICAQRRTLTYASLSAHLGGAGILKLNLNPDDWRDPLHRNEFLEFCNPEILTGDPFAFRELMKLKPRIAPKALVSSAMALLPGVRSRLESCFNCPVIDVYSLTECRMIAFSVDEDHRLLRHDLYVETLEPDRDVPTPPGERGEITITGGNNPFLNLIRYRTGDHARVLHRGNRIVLKDLQGRAPVVFLGEKNRFVNNVDIPRALSRFELAGFRVHQNRDLSVELILHGERRVEKEVLREIRAIFGASMDISVKWDPDLAREWEKPTVYSSDVEE